jgi:hypothetical protein
MTERAETDAQTDKAVYFVVSTAKDGRVSTTLERKIPLVTIRAISMTNLRDDFVVGPYDTISSSSTREGESLRAGTQRQCVRGGRPDLHMRVQDGDDVCDLDADGGEHERQHRTDVSGALWRSN